MLEALGQLSSGRVAELPGAGVEPNGSREAAARALTGLEAVAPVTVTTASGIRVHGVQTGWIVIKTNHYRLRGPAALRLPSIALGTSWAAAKPILSWVIEHPEGLVVIDTGERAGARDLGPYVACADPVNRWIITRNFVVNVEPEQELGPQLARLGLGSRDVRWVVQTHLHFDHADGFGFVRRAEVLVARAELEGHRRRPLGAVSCLYPADFSPAALDYAPRACGPFTESAALTRAEDVRIVPTPGHSYGHQSVIFRDGAETFMFAGDVVFDERQLRGRELAGVVQHVGRARNSLERVRTFVTRTPTVFLPSHDPDALTRLRERRATCLEAA